MNDQLVSSGTLTRLQTQIVSSTVAAVDFTTGIDSTYPVYLFHLTGVRLTNSGTVDLQFSSDAGATWDTAYDWIITTKDSGPAQYEDAGGSRNYVPIAYRSPAFGGNAEVNLDATLLLHGPSKATFRTHIRGTAIYKYSGDLTHTYFGAHELNNSAIDAIRFTSLNSYDFEAGTFSLYGIKS